MCMLSMSGKDVISNTGEGGSEPGWGGATNIITLKVLGSFVRPHPTLLTGLDLGVCPYLSD